MPEKYSKKTTFRRKHRKAKPSLTLAKLTQKVSNLDRRTKGGAYRFQMRKQVGVLLPTDATPLVISLSGMERFNPIFQAREDDGSINDYVQKVNKVRLGISGINYNITINDVSQAMFSVSIFIVKLKRTALTMVNAAPQGVLVGANLVTEKDYTVTPGPGTNAEAQLVMINKNVFKILYHKRHVLGRRIAASSSAGAPIVPANLVTNRKDTNVSKYYRLRHDKIFKAPYGNGWLLNGGDEIKQTIAGRPYMLIFTSRLDSGGALGAPSFVLQQVMTLKTID